MVVDFVMCVLWIDFWYFQYIVKRFGKNLSDESECFECVYILFLIWAMITKMQPQVNVAVPQSVTTQPQSQQIVGVPANAVILKMSDIQQISTVGKCIFCKLFFYLHSVH